MLLIILLCHLPGEFLKVANRIVILFLQNIQIAYRQNCLLSGFTRSISVALNNRELSSACFFICTLSEIHYNSSI